MHIMKGFGIFIFLLPLQVFSMNFSSADLNLSGDCQKIHREIQKLANMQKKDVCRIQLNRSVSELKEACENLKNHFYLDALNDIYAGRSLLIDTFRIRCDALSELKAQHREINQLVFNITWGGTS